MDKIVLIGAGNVATHMAVALAAAGAAPVQIWSRHIESAAALAATVGGRPTDDIDSVDTDAGIYIVSVADSAMASVVQRLCRRCSGGVFVHTAGTMPMDVFEGHCAHYGVLYPMQTFSKQKPLDFRSIPCFVEASDALTLATVKAMADMLSARVYELSGADRRWLHVAAVFACNFANACSAMAARILESHGIDFGVMLPLLDETVAKLHTLPPAEAQTGPAARGDRNVMNRHIEMLRDNPDLQNVYKVMSEMIMKGKA